MNFCTLDTNFYLLWHQEKPAQHKNTKNVKTQKGVSNPCLIFQKYRCPECGRMFESESKVSRHQKIHLPKEFECKFCGKKFAYKGSMTRHLYNLHPEKGKI